ncbi:MAG: hypothetical protein AB8B93_17570 [Pseudomonadales bacterium]
MSQKPSNPRFHTALQASLIALLLSSTQVQAGPVQVFEIEAHHPKVQRVTDLCPGPCAGANRPGAIFDGRLLFAGTAQAGDEKLWALKSDGAVNQASTHSPAGLQGLRDLTASNGNLYFSGVSPTTGRELWRHDGNTIELALELAAGTADGIRRLLTDYNDDLLLFGDADMGAGLFKFRNGSAELLSLGTRASGALIHQDTAWFTFNDAQFGAELWSYDGTNLVLEQDIEPGAGGSMPRLHGSLGDELVYSAFEWQGQTMFKGNLADGTVGNANTLVLDNTLYYEGSEGDQGSNGPQALMSYNGAQIVQVTGAEIEAMGSHKQSLYFSGQELSEFGFEGMFRYRNGVVEHIGSGIAGERLENARHFIEFGNKLYFQYASQAHGSEWWSITEGPRLGKVQLQLIPIWDNRYAWQMDLRLSGAPMDITYGVYKVTDDGSVSQLAQAQVHLDEKTVHADVQKGGEGFEGKVRGIATLVVAFDSKTRKKLFVHVEVTGKDKSFSSQASGDLEGMARSFGQRVGFKELVGGKY